MSPKNDDQGITARIIPDLPQFTLRPYRKAEDIPIIVELAQ